MMRRDVAQDGRQGADTKGIVSWNCDVMLTLVHGRQAKMGAGLTRELIPQAPEGLGQIVT